MITAEYSKLKGILYLKTGKIKQEFNVNARTVNDYALRCIKQYFIDTISKLCAERTNVYDHIYINMNEKNTFFYNLKLNIVNSLNKDTWKMFLKNCLHNLRCYAPSVNSRFYHNYMERLETMEAVLKKYLNTEKYYTELNEQNTMYLFDNQQYMPHYYY